MSVGTLLWVLILSNTSPALAVCIGNELSWHLQGAHQGGSPLLQVHPQPACVTSSDAPRGWQEDLEAVEAEVARVEKIARLAAQQSPSRD